MTMVDLNDLFGGKAIINAKSAKHEIGFSKKKAKALIKKGEFQEAIEIYKKSLVLCNEWALTEEIEQLEDLIRVTEIAGLNELEEIFESLAIVAEKEKFDNAAAIEYYTKTLKVATTIFKLGVTERDKKIKKLNKKIKELEKS